MDESIDKIASNTAPFARAVVAPSLLSKGSGKQMDEPTQRNDKLTSESGNPWKLESTLFALTRTLAIILTQRKPILTFKDEEKLSRNHIRQNADWRNFWSSLWIATLQFLHNPLHKNIAGRFEQWWGRTVSSLTFCALSVRSHHTNTQQTDNDNEEKGHSTDRQRATGISPVCYFPCGKNVFWAS